MSCEEDELSFGSYFSRLLIKGLNGDADDNQDGVYTAEEIFYYAKNILDLMDSQHPTILDLYPGELPLTGLINDDKPMYLGKNIAERLNPVHIKPVYFKQFIKVLRLHFR